MSSPPAFEPGDGLLLVDPQNDFCPGGSLAVADGDAVMPVLSAWADAAERAGIPIFTSRDWHPAKTTHFLEYGGVWPPHCVMGTPGAEFHPDLTLPASVRVVSKGMGETEDAYSAFQARDDAGRPLRSLLDERGVRHVYVGGLATDYCVKSSALDAVAQGFKVSLIPDGMRAVNLQATDGDLALAEMKAAGVDLA
ncbi:MAG TPA: isochorismatase family protein [Chloroflexota bacterium]|nr:isochorismatase family protein [Chloroflexota bacterium]